MTCKILIADDDQRMRRILRQIVAAAASQICEAADGAEAIRACAAMRPEWVLMDLRMSPVDGFRALVEIKAQFPETRVIIVSQYDEEELRTKALRAGACAYVLKENLLELPEILTGASARQRGSEPNPMPAVRPASKGEIQPKQHPSS